MSEETVGLVRRLGEAWDRGDLTDVLDMVSDELVSYRAHPDAATYHGKEGFMEMTLDWIEGFAEWTATNEEFIDAGDSVVTRVHQTAVGEASGIKIESDWWFVTVVRADKIVRVELYPERATAFEAAGLSE